MNSGLYAAFAERGPATRHDLQPELTLDVEAPSLTD